MAKAAKDKTELPAAPQNGSTRGSWHTATAGMYTAEGLAELRSSQAFTPKPSGGGRERRTRGGAGRAGGERVFAGEEAEMVHAAGQQGDLKEEVREVPTYMGWDRGRGAGTRDCCVCRL